MKIKRFFLETFGCQMNEYDSHLVESLLLASGLQKAPDEKSADLVIFNTCSVRQRAEERALGRIRSSGSRQRPVEIAVIGCMAPRLGTELLKANSRVKYVLGPDNIHNLPALLNGNGGKAVVDLSCRAEPPEFALPSGGISSYVTIMRCCDNFCSYCIVPLVRGRERCRPPERIIEEINRFESGGAREIWLLGQNVNSYRYGTIDFPDLLRHILENTTIPRIRFLTSHPKDFSERLVDTMAAYSRLCPGVHLPLQSGSDQILKRMQRGYTVEDYLSRIAYLKSRVAEVVLTTDIIVGFAGETEDDYLRTKAAMRQADFDAAFMFRYSVRPGTPAEKFGADIPEQVKLARLADLIAFQKEVSERKMNARVGSVQNVLLERVAPQGASDALGKTEGGLNVVVRNLADRLGEIVSVKIISSTGSTLVGEIIQQ